MKKINIALLVIGVLTTNLWSYSGYYAPYEGTTCINQGWDGGYSHGVTNSTSPYGTGKKLPYALDIKANKRKVLAVKDGEIVSTGTHYGFGKYIVIKHNDGLYSQYMHLNSISITKGIVHQGTIIGISGDTGKWAKGAPHLHIQFSIKKGLILDRESSRKVNFQGFSISSVNNINHVPCKSSQKRTSKNVIYTGNNNDSTIKKTSIIDGAGSLVSPNESCWGCDKDQANMQSHSGKNSTVVFQWRYDKNSCSQIDISADRDIGNVFIRAKGWKDKTTKVATSVKLSSSPISIRRPNRNSDWTTLAVTTQKPLTKEAKIYAYCKKKGSNYLNGDRGSASKDLVNFELDYVWSGTGSLISQSKKSNYEGFGHNRDWAITYFKKKSLTTFQWDTTTCHEITITNGKTNDYYANNVKVDIKGWNSKNWESACHELPCTLKKPNDYYYILKVKSPVGAITKGYIQVKCKD